MKLIENVCVPRWKTKVKKKIKNGIFSNKMILNYIMSVIIMNVEIKTVKFMTKVVTPEIEMKIF